MKAIDPYECDPSLHTAPNIGTHISDINIYVYYTVGISNMYACTLRIIVE